MKQILIVEAIRQREKDVSTLNDAVLPGKNTEETELSLLQAPVITLIHLV